MVFQCFSRFYLFGKMLENWSNTCKNKWKNRWTFDPKRVWKSCLRKCRKKWRKSEPKGSKMDPKIHRKWYPRGVIKGEIRNTIRKWLPGCPKSLKMSPNWSQKWAIWDQKGVENQAKFKQKVSHLALIPLCALLLPGPPNFHRCLTDAAPILTSVLSLALILLETFLHAFSQVGASGAKRSEAVLT